MEDQASKLSHLVLVLLAKFESFFTDEEVEDATTTGEANHSKPNNWRRDDYGPLNLTVEKRTGEEEGRKKEDRRTQFPIKSW